MKRFTRIMQRIAGIISGLTGYVAWMNALVHNDVASVVVGTAFMLAAMYLFTQE